ncbi:hypothetical protein Bhz59_00075 [Stenotrophomonas phage vB_SmaS_Bhz59]
MTQFYYKTKDLAVVAAIETMREESTRLRDAVKAAGEAFGGEGFCLTGIHGTGFGGIKFSPRKPLDLWCAPDRFGGQRPRTRLTARHRGNATEAQLKELRDRWAEVVGPLTRKGFSVSYEALYKALGTDWGNFIFSGIGWCESGGYLYVTTKLSKERLADHLVEVLPSEYDAATKNPTPMGGD